jgi:uncharacterized membrane protein
MHHENDAAGEADANPHNLLPTNRIEALCDGVFAIIMTLLVFDIRLPDSPPDQLAITLRSVWTSFLGYVVSFLLLSIYWMGHRSQYQLIRFADHNLHWLNLLFFALAGMIPFSTGLLAHYNDQWLAVVVYGLNLILIGVALYFHWRYAVGHPELTDGPLPPEVVRFGTIRCLLAPVCYVVAIGVGILDPRISLFAFALVPFLYIIPPLQRMWLHLARL